MHGQQNIKFSYSLVNSSCCWSSKVLLPCWAMFKRSYFKYNFKIHKTFTPLLVQSKTLSVMLHNSYVYLLHFMCICCPMCILLLLLQMPDCWLEVSIRKVLRTGHLDTGFSWFPCVYKRMLRWFPSFQVATTCLSCSPPDLNFLVTFFFVFLYM